MGNRLRGAQALLAAVAFVPFLAGLAEETVAREVLFRDVRVLDGRSAAKPSRREPTRRSSMAVAAR
jgi:hypothetical protein